MKIKKFKLLKKFLSLLLVLILCIENFAAVVSDNDGSAFITKAEFDSLKNDFQAQLDQYNTSIDSKIDGAIASYLAGIKVTKETTSNIINYNWKEVSTLNGTLANTYQLPNIDFMFAFLYYRKNGGWSVRGDMNDDTPGTVKTGDENEGNLAHAMRLQNTINWNTANSYRNLVNCTGDYTNYKDLIWDGRAIKYSETITLTRVVASFLGSTRWLEWLAWYDRPDSTSYSLEIRNVSTFKPTGYVSSWDDVSIDAWPISYYWSYTRSGTTRNVNVTWDKEKQKESFATNIELIADSSGKTKEYEHIVSYLGNTTWRVSDKKFSRLFRQANDNNNKSSTLYNASSKINTAKGESIGWYAGFGAYNTGNESGVNRNIPKYYGEIPVAHEVTDDSIVSSIGMLNSDYQANEIYQDNIEKVINVERTDIKKERPKLHEGFQLCAAKEKNKIYWEPEFSYTHVHNGATTYIDNNHEVALYFSNGPFTDDITTSNLIKVKVDNDKTLKDYATTTNRKCKVEFEMPSNGIVYVKWIPVETTYLNSDWIVTLDIDKCSTYKHSSSDE